MAVLLGSATPVVRRDTLQRIAKIPTKRREAVVRGSQDSSPSGSSTSGTDDLTTKTEQTMRDRQCQNCHQRGQLARQCPNVLYCTDVVGEGRGVVQGGVGEKREVVQGVVGEGRGVEGCGW